MSTHTPGPWTNHGRIKQAGLPHSSVAAKTLIARVYSEAFGDSEQETANARLIAAAPELLDALKDLLYYSDDVSSPLLYSNAVDAAKAAIVKATGTA